MRKSEKKMIKNVSSDTKSSTDLSLRKSHSIAHSTAHSQAWAQPRSASARTNQFCAISDTYEGDGYGFNYPYELKKGDLFEYGSHELCIFRKFELDDLLGGYLCYIDSHCVRHCSFCSSRQRLYKIS